MKESKKITLGASDCTVAATDFKYRMQGKVISITYLGAGPIREAIERVFGGSSTGTKAQLSLLRLFTRT
jgi:hypothetical protein